MKACIAVVDKALATADVAFGTDVENHNDWAVLDNQSALLVVFHGGVVIPDLRDRETVDVSSERRNMINAFRSRPMALRANLVETLFLDDLPSDALKEVIIDAPSDIGGLDWSAALRPSDAWHLLAAVPVNVQRGPGLIAERA